MHPRDLSLREEGDGRWACTTALARAMGGRPLARSSRIAPPWSYLLALAATALAFGVHLGILGSDRPLLIVFVLPAALAAYAGGLGPALVSIAVSAIGAVYCVLSPGRRFTFATPTDLAQWALFCATAYLVAWLTDSAHRSGRREEELEGRARRLELEQRAEDALRESEQRLRAIFDDVAVGIVEIDHEDRFVSVNGRFCEMLGYRWDELLGRSLHDLTAPEDRELSRRLNGRGRSGELRTFGYEKRYLRSDGTRLWVHVNVSVVRDEAGRFLRAIGTAEDISERKLADEALRRSEERFRLANEQLREADRRKDEFLGMLSHELRNPLAPIRSALFILDRAEPTSPQAQRARAVATRQVSHLTRLVDDLLDVTRIARGKIELRRQRLDLGALARQAADDQGALMHARGLALAVDVPAEPLPVHADETRIAQVLGNLLHNAAKFTPPGGRITLAVAVEGASAVVRVRDTGAGMSAAVLRTIFEPFTQAEQTLARTEGGLGLGLALVKGLVTLHGGEVGAASAGPGQGSEFVVRLPLAASGAAVGAAAA